MSEDKVLKFDCAYCGKETTAIVNVMPNLKMSATQTITNTFYCEHCWQPNKVEVPAYWNTHRLVLGRDKGFLDYRDEIPTFQGEKSS
jgi:hypothetical protein